MTVAVPSLASCNVQPCSSWRANTPVSCPPASLPQPAPPPLAIAGAAPRPLAIPRAPPRAQQQQRQQQPQPQQGAQQQQELQLFEPLPQPRQAVRLIRRCP